MTALNTKIITANKTLTSMSNNLNTLVTVSSATKRATEEGVRVQRNTTSPVLQT